MERLTEKGYTGFYVRPSKGGATMIHAPGKDVPQRYEGEIIDRLAAYEDTGLTPGELDTLRSMSNRARVANLLRLEEYQALGPLDHLRELVTAKREGRLVALPPDDYTFTIRGDVVKEIIVANCRAAAYERQIAKVVKIIEEATL